MSSSWTAFHGRGGMAGRSSGTEEGLNFGGHPYRTLSPTIPNLLSASRSPPAARATGLPTRSLHGLRPVAPHSPGVILGDFPDLSTCFAEFGELADESKIGELPTEDDLMLQLFEPIPSSMDLLTCASSPPAYQSSTVWAAPAPQPMPLGAPGGALLQQAAQGPLVFPRAHDPLISRRSTLMSLKRSADTIESDFGGVTPTKRTATSSETDTDTPRSTLHPKRGLLTRRSSGGGPQLGAGGVSSRGDAAPPAQVFRGVSRHRLTQRWEASLWLSGRQLYLGGFDSQEDAARAYDLAALACKGPDAVINFQPGEYTQQLTEVDGFSSEEVVAYVRRRSAAFSRGKSRYRGVSGQNGRWEARIGSFSGRKNVSFGIFDSEAGAARQYDRALIIEKGRSAKTNFPLRDYEAEVTQYEAHLVQTCGAVHGPAVAREAHEYTLPRDRLLTADEKKRSAIIYAEALQQVLRSVD